MSDILLILIGIVLITLVIVFVSLVGAFGKIVESGGNPSTALTNLLKDGANCKQNDKEHEFNKTKPAHQSVRTIAGVLFGILLLYPLLYSPEDGGTAVININHQVRDYLLCILLVAEVTLFIVMWVQDRKPK